MKLSVTLAAVLAVGGLALAGCGSSGSSGAQATGGHSPGSSMSSPMTSPSGGSSPSSGGASAAKAMIMIKNSAYSGSSSVPAGATVTVMNQDSTAHTVTSDTGGLFNITIEPGKSATFTAPKKPGTYTYHCNFHGNMHGTLVVK